MQSPGDLTKFCGFYSTFGFLLEVKIQEGELCAVVPGVPSGYEIILQVTDNSRLFRMLGGPLDGAVCEFRGPEGEQAAAIGAGEFELQRVMPDALPGLEVVERLTLPPVVWDPAKRAAFDELLRKVTAGNRDDWVTYDLPYPRHEFLQHAADSDRFIFHGSNNTEIERFLPFRKSFELRDATGRGNLPAVYGTHDGIWPMFFAIVDRERLSGSIRNGVMYFNNRQGERLAVYNFSINREMLAERPYCTGAVYFLPRDSFRRLKLVGDAWSNEWASQEPVDPIARLLLRPEDFPFLEQIGGHDDSTMLRHNRLFRAVLAAVQGVAPTEDGFILTLRWDSETRDDINAFLVVRRELDAVGEYSLQPAGDSPTAKLTMKLPPALRQVLESSLREIAGKQADVSGPDSTLTPAANSG